MLSLRLNIRRPPSSVLDGVLTLVYLLGRWIHCHRRPNNAASAELYLSVEGQLEPLDPELAGKIQVVRGRLREVP